MCRYGFSTYKSHYLCFNCRKQFKQYTVYEKMGKNLADRFSRLDKIANGEWHLPKYHEKYEKGQVFTLTAEEQQEYEYLKKRYHSDTLCPQCRQPMAHVGMDIKAPKMKDKEAWEVLEKTYQLGYTFFSCGCSGPGFVPQNKEDYRVFLEKRLAEYETNVQRCITEEKTGESDARLYTHDRIYWSKNVQKIQEVIAKI